MIQTATSKAIFVLKYGGSKERPCSSDVTETFMQSVISDKWVSSSINIIKIPCLTLYQGSSHGETEKDYALNMQCHVRLSSHGQTPSKWQLQLSLMPWKGVMYLSSVKSYNLVLDLLSANYWFISFLFDFLLSVITIIYLIENVPQEHYHHWSYLWCSRNVWMWFCLHKTVLCEFYRYEILSFIAHHALFSASSMM